MVAKIYSIIFCILPDHLVPPKKFVISAFAMIVMVTQKIALLLALSLVMSLSAPVYATETAESEAAEADSVSSNLINPAVDWALDKLAGEALTKIGSKSIDEAFSLIYEDKTTSVLASLQAMDEKRFDAIDKQLGDMQTQLKEISKKIETNDLGQKLDGFTTYMTDYKTLYNKMSTRNSQIGNDPKLTKEYLTLIYNGNLNYSVGSHSIPDATLNLGRELTRVYYSNSCNIFDTFDTLDKYTNHCTLKLTANIDYPLPITLNGCGVNIDLNGYTLNVQPDSAAPKNIEPDGSTVTATSVTAAGDDVYGVECAKISTGISVAPTISLNTI
ncbi:hypothetical protein [Acetobacterium sp.]|uniref:hypothetical protein n=1 Tax=Acetobacterium sp. TaxID=1872094 RepID=UPI00271642C9|nr:hypothetical protein [Acetobacterium sp.]MDO9491030.1 hypothetical protein [Acetobacterium sp.]